MTKTIVAITRQLRAGILALERAAAGGLQG